jgi:DNA-binding MarR family transcriptional regulator
MKLIVSKPTIQPKNWGFRNFVCGYLVYAKDPLHWDIATEANNMIIHDSHRGPGFLLTDSARLLRKLIDRRLQPLGLSRAQWSILAILSNHDGLSQSQISDKLEIEKSTAGRLIDQVEKSGWVARRPIPGDRRLWGVHLTEQARQLISEVENVILDTRAEMLRGLSAEQQQTLSGMLQTVKSNLSAALELDQAQLHQQRFEHTTD